MTRPRCGNDPRAQLTDDDRRAVEDFKAYLAERAALRDRIAEALEQADYRPDMRRGDLADAIMPVLPPPVDRAELDSLGREADRLRKAWGEMRDRAERIEAEVKRMRADRATEVEQLRIKNERMRHELEVMYSGAFDSTEPTNRAAILATTLREVLDTFSPMKDTHDGPVAYYDGSADIEPKQYDRWRAVLDGELRRMADETATTETQPPALSPTERTMLDYALDQAQERIWSEDGFTDEDQAAVDSLRRLARTS